MFKQNTDVFLVNELIGNNLTDLIVEGDVYLPENLPNMEKIIYTNGKIKLTNCTALTNKIAVYGQLDYTILYTGGDESYITSSINGKIDFMEEIPVQGTSEGMNVSVLPSIDYIDAKIISEHKSTIKAVVNINAEVTNSHNIEYISGIESDGSLQAKTSNFTYTDVAECKSSQMTLNDTIILDNNVNEIYKILLFNAYPIITEKEIINDRMLIEGVCKVGVLYTENDDEKTINYVTKDFPFTHYIELNDSQNEFLNELANIDIDIQNISYELIKDENDENKILDINLDLIFKLCVYEKINKNMISDAYSTTNSLDIENSTIKVTSIVDIINNEEKIEKTFDIEDSSVKEIYYYDACAKLSEKNIYDDNMVIDGFIDLNVIYVDSDTGKIENTSSSLPFNMNIDLTNYDSISDIDCEISLTDTGAYRKGPNSILFEAKIQNKIKVKNNINVSVISNIVENEKLSNKNSPSIIFRVVQPNETLWDIAKDYNISMNYLCKTNDIDINDSLEIGKKIVITKQI